MNYRKTYKQMLENIVNVPKQTRIDKREKNTEPVLTSVVNLFFIQNHLIRI